MRYNSSPSWIFSMFKLSQVISTNQFLVALDRIPVVTDVIDFWNYTMFQAHLTNPAQTWNHVFPLNSVFLPLLLSCFFFNMSSF